MRIALLAYAFSLAACVRSPVAPAMSVVGSTGELKRLEWLSGSWSNSEANAQTEEHWTLPSTNLMLGINRTVAKGDTVHHEQLRIEARPDGVFYVASPSGQQTTAFKLVEQGEMYAVFENPEHDFPKRIVYRRSGRSLHVRIEGKAGDRVAQWRWTRSALPRE